MFANDHMRSFGLYMMDHQTLFEVWNPEIEDAFEESDIPSALGVVLRTMIGESLGLEVNDDAH